MSAAADRCPAAAPTNAARLRRGVAELGCGFVFWLAFDLVLEPGNLVRAAHAGLQLDWPQEAIRLVGAGLLGAPTWPFLAWRARRLPVAGALWARHAAIQAAAIAVLAPALIIAAQPFAQRLSATSVRGDLGDQIASNLLLLTSALAALALGTNLLERRRGGASAVSASAPARIAVTNRGSTRMVELDDIDWIESQGNYLALHVGQSTHLVRQTLARFQTGLDPHAFVRIHRGAIVRLARVRQVRPLGNGDAAVELDTGLELRASRAHARTLRERLRGTKLPPA